MLYSIYNFLMGLFKPIMGEVRVAFNPFGFKRNSIGPFVSYLEIQITIHMVCFIIYSSLNVLNRSPCCSTVAVFYSPRSAIYLATSQMASEWRIHVINLNCDTICLHEIRDARDHKKVQKETNWFYALISLS